MNSQGGRINPAASKLVLVRDPTRAHRMVLTVLTAVPRFTRNPFAIVARRTRVACDAATAH
jgi:hypothetical protein